MVRVLIAEGVDIVDDLFEIFCLVVESHHCKGTVGYGHLNLIDLMHRGVVGQDNEGTGALLSPAGPLGVGTEVSIIDLGATENQLVETHPKLAQSPLLKHLL